MTAQGMVRLPGGQQGEELLLVHDQATFSAMVRCS
jgi:hypothetical protein